MDIILLFRLTENSSISNFLCPVIFFSVKEVENSWYSLSISIFIPINSLIAIPSPSSNNDKNNSVTDTSLSLFSLLLSIAVSKTLFNNGVYKNQSLVVLPIPTTLINSSLNLS